MTQSAHQNKLLHPSYQIRAQGDRCLSIDFGDSISAETGRICLSAAATFRRAALAGVVDITPSFNSVALHYIPLAHRRGSSAKQSTIESLSFESISFESLTSAVAALIEAGLPEIDQLARTVEIPVCYGGQHGPDLSFVANCTGLTEAQVIERHSNSDVMVFTLGFAPGLPYIGVHDPIFSIPRRDTPRTAVPAGSVAVANRQSTIYPNLLPGGWHILGATPLAMFDMRLSPPSRLMPGDSVKFVPITAAEYDKMAEARGLAS
jgi:KipI family sensor histidine kinase inhibitor